MEKDISSIKQDIYNFAKEYEIYKNNSFIEACFKLTCAVEESFIDMILLGTKSLRFDLIPSLQDKFRGAYREALKNAYKFCKADKENIELKLDRKELNTICENLAEYFDFNEVRNLFGQTELGKYTLKMNSDKEITFVRNKARRTINSELYARWVDHEKPEIEERKASNDIEKELYRYMVDPSLIRYYDMDEPTLIKFTQFKKIYNVALQKVKSDSEELENYNFVDFSTGDFQNIYAAFIALSVITINYHFVSRILGKVELNRYKPIVIIKYEQLINLIQRCTRTPLLTIKSVVQYLIYDPAIHADKITIYQPVLLAGETIFFSPSIIYYSMTYDKVLYLAKESKSFESLISKLAKERERIIINNLCNYIESNSDLLYITNFVIREDNKPIAEFDLILYDERNKKLLLTELKWFFKGDGEYDHFRTDRKIKDTIADRIRKEQIAQAHLLEIQKELDIVEDKDIEIKSCVVSKNFSGSDFIDDDLPILDEYLFKKLLLAAGFNLSEIFKMFNDKTYLPNMESLGFCYIPRTIECSGYKINFEGLAYAENNE